MLLIKTNSCSVDYDAYVIVFEHDYALALALLYLDFAAYCHAENVFSLLGRWWASLPGSHLRTAAQLEHARSDLGFSQQQAMH